MGLLVPGILQVGDIPHLGALNAPRKLIVTEGINPQGKKLNEKALTNAFAFTRSIYKVHKSPSKLTIAASKSVEHVANEL
jgi:hypothetical protein